MKKQKKQLKCSTIAKLAKICIFSRPYPKIFVESLTKCISFHPNLTSEVQLFSPKPHQQSATLSVQNSQKILRELLGGSVKIYYFCTGKFGKVLSDYTKSNFVVQNHGNLPRHY
jgi:hypothetical protein